MVALSGASSSSLSTSIWVAVSVLSLDLSMAVDVVLAIVGGARKTAGDTAVTSLGGDPYRLKERELVPQVQRERHQCGENEQELAA